MKRGYRENRHPIFKDTGNINYFANIKDFNIRHNEEYFIVWLKMVIFSFNVKM
jgi:hypothetical protein